MKIAVGSLNPVKIGAVRSVTSRIWPDANLVTFDAPSGIRAMPMSDEECILGSLNRARHARDAMGADFGFGLEGGVNQEPSGLMLVGWAAVIDANDQEGIGGGARLPLPPIITRRIMAGEELGPVMDDILGQENVRQKGGAVGALTGELILREETFALAVAFALSRFVVPQFYDRDPD